MDVVLTEENVMLPGTQLADLAELEITARVALGGSPTATAGDIFGTALWQRTAADGLEIVLDQVVP